MDLPTVLAIAVVAATALGVAAYYYGSDSLPKSADRKARAFFEVWKAGPWAVRARDIKGTPKIVELRVHPVKSCRDVAAREVTYDERGIEYDRKWCIIDDRSHRILTQRDLPQMVRIMPEIDRAAGFLRVSFPPDADCEAFEAQLDPPSAETAEWQLLDEIDYFSWSGIAVLVVPAGAESLSRFLGRPVLLAMRGPRVRKADKTGLYPALAGDIGLFDDCPLHVLSMESVRAAAGLLRDMAGSTGVQSRWREQALDWRRFRANVVLDGAGVPFAEDAWAELAFGASGGPSTTIVSRMYRCTIPNTDQDTGEVDPSLLKVLLNRRNNVALEGNAKAKGCLGVNCFPNGRGVIRVGDEVRVEKWLTT